MTPAPAGTPWWAWAIVVVALALIEWRASRSSRRATTAAASTKEGLQRVLDHVANNHPKGLRDDLDEKFEGMARTIGTIADGQDAIRRDVGGLHSEVRDAREEISHARDDIAGLQRDGRRGRRDAATLRRSVGELQALADTALERAQGVIDHNHPGVQLRDPDPDT